ncbi:MAG: copper resistance CopC/CopD family protein [Neoaquamicrobium sediminum]|uniref:copper resistance CopC/CopD family protein n=1 Tax=Neoaquamicrobium sediminum TaxID=1849104 RepID=UPI00403513DC
MTSSHAFGLRGTITRLWTAATMALLTTTMALSHAALNSTQPIDGSVVDAPPTGYTLTFSEPISPLTLRLVRPDGSATELDNFRVEGNAVVIAAPSDLVHGTHVLSWRVVSADGHPIGGSLVFSIGEASASLPPVAEPVDRQVQTGIWLTKLTLYVGLFMGIGGAFAVAWLLPQSHTGSNAVIVAVLVGFAGTGLSPGFQGLDALGASLSSYFDRLIWMTAMETSYGYTVVAMLVALFCALFAMLVPSPDHSRLLSLAGVVGGAGALALSGHASAASPQWLTRPAVILHAGTIALWIGALVPLGLALRRSVADAAVGLKRFSAMIPYALVALIAAGIALAVVQVETPSALVETDYGRLLLAKLGLLIVLFAIAAFNRWRLTADAAEAGGTARRCLVRSIAVETLLASVVFALAAGWRFTPPPRALAISAAQPAQVHIHTAQAMADVTIIPGRAGPVSVSAVLMTGEFGPLDAKEVTFVFSNPAAGIEAFRRKAEKPGNGTWRAEDVVLPLPGNWTIRIDILINDFEIVRIQGQVGIRD